MGSSARLHVTIVVLAVALLYGLWVVPVLRTSPPIIPYDTFRDVAYAKSVLLGNSWLEDPAVKGMRIWYPPLNPLFFAALSAWSGAELDTLYSWSVVWINALVPLVFWVFVWRVFDARVATMSALLIPVSPWLRTHLFVYGMTSMHAVAVILVAAAVIARAYRQALTLRAAAVIGLLSGVALLHHAVSGGIIYAGMVAALLLQRRTLAPVRPLATMLVVAFVPLAAVGWFLVPNLLQPRLNPAPIEYFAPELAQPGWVLFLPNSWLAPLTLVLAAAGAHQIWARRRTLSAPLTFFSALVIVTIAGQGLGYTRVALEHLAPPALASWAARIPMVVPHEFQWYFQLFLLPVVALGMLSAAARLSPRRRGAIAAALVIALSVPAIHDMVTRPRLQAWPGVREDAGFITWILEHTERRDVIACNDEFLTYSRIQARTARPILAQGLGHMNYNVDAEARTRDGLRLFEAADERELRAIAQRYGIRYLVVLRSKASPERLLLFTDVLRLAYEDGEVAIFDLGIARSAH